MIRVHPREEIVTAARIDLRTRLSEWSLRHQELTTAEWIQVVIGVCQDQIQSLLKYEIRIERHGNTDKPGGTE